MSVGLGGVQASPVLVSASSPPSPPRSKLGPPGSAAAVLESLAYADGVRVLYSPSGQQLHPPHPIIPINSCISWVIQTLRAGEAASHATPAPAWLAACGDDSVPTGAVVWRESIQAVDVCVKKAPAGALVEAYDATELHNAHEKLRAAEAAVAAKSSLVGQLSHEIRTPMNGIIGMLQCLQASDLLHSQRDCVDSAMFSSRALLNTLTDVLDLQMASSKQLKVDVVPKPLRNLMLMAEEVALLWASSAHAKGLSLVVDYPFEHATSTDSFAGSIDRMRQVTVNLVSNAIKYTREGSIRITLAVQPELPIDGQHRADTVVGTTPATTDAVLSPWVSVAVSDTGVGVPADVREKIFSQFFRNDPEGLGQELGSAGLGLAITAAITSLLGGHITLQSTVGVGSTFTLWVPMEPIEGDSPRSIVRSPASRGCRTPPHTRQPAAGSVGASSTPAAARYLRPSAPPLGHTMSTLSSTDVGKRPRVLFVNPEVVGEGVFAFLRAQGAEVDIATSVAEAVLMIHASQRGGRGKTPSPYTVVVFNPNTATVASDPHIAWLRPVKRDCLRLKYAIEGRPDLVAPLKQRLSWLDSDTDTTDSDEPRRADSAPTKRPAAQSRLANGAKQRAGGRPIRNKPLLRVETVLAETTPPALSSAPGSLAGVTPGGPSPSSSSSAAPVRDDAVASPTLPREHEDAEDAANTAAAVAAAAADTVAALSPARVVARSPVTATTSVAAATAAGDGAHATTSVARVVDLLRAADASLSPRRGWSRPGPRLPAATPESASGPDPYDADVGTPVPRRHHAAGSSFECSPRDAATTRSPDAPQSPSPSPSPPSGDATTSPQRVAQGGHGRPSRRSPGLAALATSSGSARTRHRRRPHHLSHATHAPSRWSSSGDGHRDITPAAAAALLATSRSHGVGQSPAAAPRHLAWVGNSSPRDPPVSVWASATGGSTGNANSTATNGTSNGSAHTAARTGSTGGGGGDDGSTCRLSHSLRCGPQLLLLAPLSRIVEVEVDATAARQTSSSPRASSPRLPSTTASPGSGTTSWYDAWLALPLLPSKFVGLFLRRFAPPAADTGASPAVRSRIVRPSPLVGRRSLASPTSSTGSMLSPPPTAHRTASFAALAPTCGAVASLPAMSTSSSSLVPSPRHAVAVAAAHAGAGAGAGSSGGSCSGPFGAPARSSPMDDFVTPMLNTEAIGGHPTCDTGDPTVHPLAAALRSPDGDDVGAMVMEDVHIGTDEVRVLVVDDNRVNRKVAKRLLQAVLPTSAGLRVDFGTHGGEAVDMFKADPWRYSIVLMDIQMPVLDGIQATAALREIESEVGRSPRTPVIAMTAGAADDPALASASFDDHLAKPVILDSLRLMLQKWLDQLA